MKITDEMVERVCSTYWGENWSLFSKTKAVILKHMRAALEAAVADVPEPVPEAVKHPSFDWYWPEDDTSSDACADGPWQIAENIDAKPGEVFGYARGGVVEVRYFGSLPAAEDSDSDDEFEVDEPTREAAEAKMAVEVARRAAINAEGK